MSGSVARNSLLAPIVIGVVGHIEVPLDARPRLERASLEILEHFLREFPNTPLRVLTSMATGADQIVAKAAEAIGGDRV